MHIQGQIVDIKIDAFIQVKLRSKMEKLLPLLKRT